MNYNNFDLFFNQLESQLDIYREKITELPHKVNILGTKEVASRMAKLLVENGVEIGKIFSNTFLEQGSEFLGKIVTKPILDTNLTIICSYNYGFIPKTGENQIYWADFLNQYAISGSLPWNCLSLNLKTLQANRNLLKEIYIRCIDENSKIEFLKQIHARVDSILSIDSISSSPEFCEPKYSLLDASKTILDCGAFDGDTAEIFLREFGDEFGPKIICVEPDILSISRILGKFRNDHRVEYFNTLLSKDVSIHEFRPSGEVTSSFSNNQDLDTSPLEYINSTTIDNLITLRDIDFIKMDIEGSELDALEGARRKIASKSSVFAISIYHKVEDIYEIPAKFLDGYHFGFVANAQRPWDSVFYAIPDKSI